ncbi:MAG: hypothetical protein Q9O62_01860 [Ardenticatenia bacterium]|nr:hypothetical protein [Ardenticatenia bacterium]
MSFVHEGLISPREAVLRVSPDQVESLLHPQFDPQAKAQAVREGRLLAKGVNASPGAGVGQAVFDADRGPRSWGVPVRPWSWCAPRRSRMMCTAWCTPRAF